MTGRRRLRDLGLLEFHIGLIGTWTVMLPVAFATGWIYSVVFVNVLSIVALIVGSASAAQAAWADRKNPQT